VKITGASRGHQQGVDYLHYAVGGIVVGRNNESIIYANLPSGGRGDLEILSLKGGQQKSCVFFK